MYQSEAPRTRRNGKLQACEPCRKSKLRCDHTRPICGRCNARGMQQLCYYHPAPMTKRLTRFVELNPQFKSSETGSSSISTNSTRSTRLPSVEAVTPKSGMSASPKLAGYLGSTSYSAVLAEHQRDMLAEADGEHFFNAVGSQQSIDPDRVQAGVQVLMLCYNHPEFCDLMVQYYSRKWCSALPLAIVDKIADGIRNFLRTVNPSRPGPRLREFALQIFRNSSRPLPRSKSMAHSDYASTFSGENTRWETMALLYASATSSLLDVDVSHPILAPLGHTAEAKQKLLSMADNATNTCVTFCDDAASTNELLAAAQYTDVLVRTQLFGDASYLAWRRLGDLSATVYAAGLHRIDGPADNNCPFFVKQIRRGCFALAFYADKCVATFVGRPPLINHRYCSLDAPLDVSDDILFSEGDVLERGLAELDENGWDRHGRRHRVSPIRIRYILSVFREEVLEIALGDGYQGDLQEKARQILAKAQAAWDACPDYFRFDRQAPELREQPFRDLNVKMQYLLYMDYLHSTFLLHRAVVKNTAVGHQALFDTARQLLSSVLATISNRDGPHGLNTAHGRHFSWLILYYGLPSACVLAFEILRQSQQVGPPAVLLPRAEIIRNLSVFTSSLSWVAKPDQGNYATCKEAEDAMTRILDRILDPPPPTVTEDFSFVQNLASGMEGYLDWNSLNWDLVSDAFAF